MNWDQIENKWAAMTRRVRPDWPLAEDFEDGPRSSGSAASPAVSDAADLAATRRPTSIPSQIE